jgi:hypothetical protein
MHATARRLATNDPGGTVGTLQACFKREKDDERVQLGTSAEHAASGTVQRRMVMMLVVCSSE